jgi:hypothetical protein
MTITILLQHLQYIYDCAYSLTALTKSTTKIVMSAREKAKKRNSAAI